MNTSGTLDELLFEAPLLAFDMPSRDDLPNQCLLLHVDSPGDRVEDFASSPSVGQWFTWTWGDAFFAPVADEGPLETISMLRQRRKNDKDASPQNDWDYLTLCDYLESPSFEPSSPSSMCPSTPDEGSDDGGGIVQVEGAFSQLTHRETPKDRILTSTLMYCIHG